MSSPRVTLVSLAGIALPLVLIGCGTSDEGTGRVPTTESSSDFTLPDRRDEGVAYLAIEGDSVRQLVVECNSLLRSMTYRAYDDDVLVRVSLTFSKDADESPEIGLLELDVLDETYFLEGARIASEDALGRRGEIRANGTLSSADIRDDRAVSIGWDCT